MQNHSEPSLNCFLFSDNLQRYIPIQLRIYITKQQIKHLFCLCRHCRNKEHSILYSIEIQLIYQTVYCTLGLVGAIASIVVASIARKSNNTIVTFVICVIATGIGFVIWFIESLTKGIEYEYNQC